MANGTHDIDHRRMQGREYIRSTLVQLVDHIDYCGLFLQIKMG